jgi:hypothetical protein
MRHEMSELLIRLINKLMLTSLAKCACIVSLLVFATSAAGQIPKRFAVFAGYSSRADFTQVSFLPISLPSVSLNGWNGSLEVKVLPFLGIVGDFSGYYNSVGATVRCEAIVVCVPLVGNLSSSLYSFLVGPQVSVSLWRFTPFAHALIGVARIDQKVGIGAGIAALSGFANTNTSFSDGFGGGIDFRIVLIVHWRFQADLLQTRFSTSQNPLSFLTNTQNGFRGSTGIVVRF